MVHVLETLAGTVLLHFRTGWAPGSFRGRISKFVPGLRTPLVRGGLRWQAQYFCTTAL